MKLRVLVACEYSGRVRQAFRALGHDAWSCDLLESEGASQSYHIVGPVERELQPGRWDLMIAHPPCTHLSMAAPIPRICIENPVSIISTRIKKPSQIIQPWMFGHGETKTTCLWLKGLHKLVPTNIVAGRSDRIHKMPPSPTRWKERSRTYQGIADAFAAQWGGELHAPLEEQPMLDGRETARQDHPEELGRN